MKTQLDIAGLTEEQIALLQSIIHAFKTQNTVDSRNNEDSINMQTTFPKGGIFEALTNQPIPVQGVRQLTRDEIHQR